MKVERHQQFCIIAIVFFLALAGWPAYVKGEAVYEKIRTEQQAIDAALKACSGQLVTAAKMPGWKATYKDALWKVSGVGPWWAFHVSISAITGYPLERCRLVVS